MKHFARSSTVSTLTTLAFAAFLGACGSSSQEQSETKVTNGREIQESEFPSVVLLYSEISEGGSICTGTFVSSDQLITAGHCVEDLDFTSPSLYYVSPGSDGGLVARAKALRIQRNPRYSISLGVSPSDLAVVTFRPNTAPATSVITSVSPQAEDPFTIVGYGNNETTLTETGITGEGSGVKRVGTNRVLFVEDGMIVFVGTAKASEPGLELGEFSLSGSGDSGGPLFINGRLAGVTSGGGFGTLEDGTQVAVARYVDLTSAESRAFLASALRRR